MIYLFNNPLFLKIHEKKIVAITIIVSLFFIYLFSISLLCLLHKSFSKIFFITVFSIISFIHLSSIYILFKWFKYLKNIINIIDSNKEGEFLKGVLLPIDTYQITISGLLYTQYLLKNESERLIYVLNGIDVSNIINKNVNILIKDSILYGYEVTYE